MATKSTMRKNIGTAAVRVASGGSQRRCMKNEAMNHTLTKAMLKRMNIVALKLNSCRMAITSMMVKKTSQPKTAMKPFA